MFALYIVHGGYDDWSDWGTCSETCGEGQKTRSRSCTNPAPAYGGDDCTEIGDATESQTCNDGPCPGMCPMIRIEFLIYSRIIITFNHRYMYSSNLLSKNV